MRSSETRFAVLLFTDLVGSTDLKQRHGVPVFAEALRIHNGHFERLIGECRGLRILQNLGDGYFAQSDSVAEAVKFALLFQEAMRAGPWSAVRLATRVGIHAGEITELEAAAGSGIVGPAADLAARVMGLAEGGQILLTRFPFDEARHFLREHPLVAGKAMPPLRWLAHGLYLLKGCDDPLEIFEVGPENLAPLRPPPDGEKAKRAIRPGEEETLGWRPAAGLEIPGRTGWQLAERLGAGGFGEVWVGEHAKLHERRAFKFCFDEERLRALKREVTLFRLLRSALGERDDIVHLHELKLDAPPFYLESDLAPHGNLLQWAGRQGGLEKIPLARRITLVAHTATALAAAHSIGVLHKDIKPTNILIFDGPGGEPRPRLVDFGIGTLADPGVLAQWGITGAGFTRVTIAHSTGTPAYSPPEYLAGRPYTIQGDVYGLGVLLYQLVTAKPLEPLAAGWERDIADPLLRADIAACVDGDPARRLPSAADLADRLLRLDARRAEVVEKERVSREATALAEAKANAETARLRASRFRKLAAAFGLFAVLAIGGAAVAYVSLQEARRERTHAEQEFHRAESEKATAQAATAEATKQAALAGQEKAHAVGLVRFMDVQIGEAFSELPFELRERVSDRLDAFYRSQGEPATSEERRRRVSHLLRRAQVHLAGVEFFERENFSGFSKQSYISAAYTNAHAELDEALRHGDLLAREDAGDRSVTRDRILTHLQLSTVCGQVKNPDAASQHLRAARELLDALVTDSPFSPAQWTDWMGLPKLDAAPGDQAEEAGGKTGSNEGFQKTKALPLRFVPVPGTAVQFSIYETRVRDFRTFIRETGYAHMRESSVPDSRMMTIDKDGSKARGHTWEDPGFPQTEDHPVVGVSWQDAKAFCAWLTLRERAAGRLPANWEYRLPTDREWSVAVGLAEEEDRKVRAGDDLTNIRFKYPWGDWPKYQPPPEGAGNIGGMEADDGHLPKTFVPIEGYRDGFPRTAPVGSFHANPLGIFDLDGNVCEWCEDEDDLKPGYRLARGAYWMSFRRLDLLSAYRRSERPGRRNAFYGFRCVLGPANP